MSLWHGDPAPQDLNRMLPGTLMEALGVEITDIGADSITGTMPVDERTRQPYGLLHGGASVALAETLASTGANAVLDPARARAVGLEINANHLRTMTEGTVTGTARPLHVGRSTQVWEVRITDQGRQLVCISRVTLAVRPVGA